MLGLAVVVVAVGCVLYLVADELWGEGGEEWDQLIVIGGAAATIPAWLTHAVGLLLGGLYDRRARNHTV